MIEIIRKIVCTLAVFILIVAGLFGLFGLVFAVFSVLEAVDGTIWEWVVLVVLSTPFILFIGMTSYFLCEDLQAESDEKGQ